MGGIFFQKFDIVPPSPNNWVQESIYHTEAQTGVKPISYLEYK